jgi:hypothetical protein
MVPEEMKRKVAQRGFIILLVVIGQLAFWGGCAAFPYRPPAAVSIVSEYPTLGGSAPPNTQVWKVIPEVAPDGAATLRFFLEASAEAAAVCEIRLPSPGTAGEIQWNGVGKTGQKKSSAGMLLVPGFPAPSDVLPVEGAHDGVYEERIDAGGRVFSKSYRVSFAAFSVSDGKAKGWVRAEDPGWTRLIMVTVTDEKGRPVVKQLWPADGSWWLYEETPLRRSWLIN